MTSLIVTGFLIATSVIVSAGDLAFHLSKEDTREISRESMVKGRLEWSEDEGESIIVSVYSPGKRVGELKLEDLELQGIYDTARANTDVGPFFSLVDEYIVGDEKDRWFLVQYEYKRPGSDRHFNRFRIGRLSRIVEGADLFFLVDYMQDSSDKALTAKMTEFGGLKQVTDRRGQDYRMLLRAAGIEENEEGEQDGTEQPATRPESKSEGSDKPEPEAEGRSR
jgi:hypothetical protein